MKYIYRKLLHIVILVMARAVIWYLDIVIALLNWAINDVHEHQCPRCKNIWKHNGTDIKSQKQNEEEHTCPECKHHSLNCYARL